MGKTDRREFSEPVIGMLCAFHLRRTFQKQNPEKSRFSNRRKSFFLRICESEMLEVRSERSCLFAGNAIENRRL